MSVAYRETTLPNGLRIAAEVDPEAHSAAMGFFVKTGARDETSELMGVSHFLEHMMFKGTERRSAADVDLDFDRIGANHNAYTTAEMTVFYFHCLPDFLGTGENVLSDIMRPALRQADFDDEKKVILEEIAMYEDNPFWVLYERAMEVYYGAHPLGHRVLGTSDTIRAMTQGGMQAYFDERYSADNTTVAIAGRVDFDAVVEQLAAHCGHWARTNTARAYPAVTPATDTLEMESERASLAYTLMLAPAPALGDDRRYAASILGQVLGDSEGSRLYWSLVEEGLAEEAVAQYDGRDGTGDYLVYAACAREDAERVEAVVRREIDALIDSITEDDLVRVRNKVATAATLHGELPNGRMRRVGRVLTYNGEYRSLEDELARIDAVTLDELRSVHAEFPLAPKVIAQLMPA